MLSEEKRASKHVYKSKLSSRNYNILGADKNTVYRIQTELGRY